MLWKKIQCLVRKVDVISLPILPLNIELIIEIVDILHCLVECWELTSIVKDIVIPIKVTI